MRNTVDKAIGVILPIVLFFFFCYASAQEKQDEPKDAKFFIDRGIAYVKKGEIEWAMDDFNKAIQIDPKNTDAYFNRAIVYFIKEEYDKSWLDIKRVQELGKTIPVDFLNKLRKASGKQM